MRSASSKTQRIPMRRYIARSVLSGSCLRKRLALLREHFVRILFETGQIERIARLTGGRAACEWLFAQSHDWNARVGLVAYWVQADDWELANARIEEIIEACDNPTALWRLSDILLPLGRKSDADRIYQKLSGHVAEDPEAALYCALSFERLLSPEKAADRLESELARYPDSALLRE